MNRSLLISSCTYLLPVVLFLTILGYLPLTPNPLTSPKHALLIVSSMIPLLLWGATAIKDRVAVLPKSRLSFPLFLLIVVLILNMAVNRDGWFEAAVGRGSIYIAASLLGVWALFLPDPRRAARYAIFSLVGSSFILALHSLLQLTVLYRIESLPDIMNTRAFTFTGSPLTSFIILIISAAAAFYYATRALKGSAQYAFFVAATVETIAAVAYLSILLPGNELAPAILPYQESWAVTLDSLKSGKSIVFGVGLANFTQLLSAVRPLSLNATPFWNSLPSSAGSELLHLLATTGVLGLSAFLLVPLTALSHKEHDFALSTLTLISILSLIALAATPASIPLLALLFISLGLRAPRTVEEIHLKSAPSFLTPSLLAVGCAGAIVYFTGRQYSAENHMWKAQKALAAQDGKAVYDEHIAAIKLAPRMAGYRLSYAQVNLSLASAMSQKQNLSDSEREQVATLIQQAIREAKVAVSLRPNDARNWQNLGALYRNLINVASGADQFAVTSYAQAVTLDPGNPFLRVELGGLLYQLGGAAKEDADKKALLTRAVQEFQTAVQLKPDYANAYYNLGKALESAGNVQAAYAAMQRAVASLDPSSPDLNKATADLETLKTKLPKASPSPTTSPSPSPTSSATPARNDTLSQPSPLPSPIAGGPINLPDSSPLPSPTPTE